MLKTLFYSTALPRFVSQVVPLPLISVPDPEARRKAGRQSQLPRWLTSEDIEKKRAEVIACWEKE